VVYKAFDLSELRLVAVKIMPVNDKVSTLLKSLQLYFDATTGNV
jgi:hypothetical protein